MKFASVLQIAFSLAGVVGGVLAVVLSTTQKESMRLLRDNNRDHKDRIETLEGRLETAEAGEARCNERIEVLTEAVTRAAAVDRLAEAVENHHREVMLRLDAR